MRRAVVLTIDGLGSKFLGPYGNTWIETQAFNQLAADSLLLDGLAAPHADVTKSLESLWSSDPPDWMREREIRAKLFTDDANLLDTQLASQFDEHMEVPSPTGMKLASEWDETHAAQFFAQTIDAVNQLEPNSLLWIHSRGLGNPWDAPYEFRAQFADEEDPEPSGSSQVPSLKLDKDFDPDTLHEIQCAYAGQIALLDECLGVLLSVLQAGAEEMLFVLTSPRGFPLGEHLRVGWQDTTLHHELLSVPGFVRFPNRSFALRRESGLFELADLPKLISHWFANDEEAALLEQVVETFREYSLSEHDREIVLRTPVWQIRFEDFGGEKEAVELYLKPDDQNEVNDVSDRCEEIVEAGRQFLKELNSASSAEEKSKLELPEILLEPIE